MALTPQEQQVAQNRFQLTTDPTQLESSYRAFQTYQGGNTGNAAITSSNLTPQPSLTLPPPQSSQAGMVADNLTTQASNLVKQQEENLTAAQTEKDQSKNDFTQAFNDYLGVSSQVSNLPEQNQLLTTKQAADTINSKIEGVNRATQNAITKIQNDPSLTKEQAQVRINEMERQRSSQVADYSIELSAQTRQISTLQDSIQSKISLLQEPLKLKYDFFKTFYEDNKQNLTKAEDRLFQVKNQDYQNQITQQTKLHDELGKIVEEASLGGANASVIAKIFASKDVGEAYALAGSYLKNTPEARLKEANIAKVYSDIKGNSNVDVPINIPNGQAYQNAFNNAVLGLPLASQKIATQTFANYLNQGDTEGARQYLVRMATQGLPAADQTQALGRAQATASLKEIDTLLEEAKNNGAGTNIVTGSLVNISGRLGASTNPDLAYIGARIQQQLQVYRRSMTGVAFSPQESKEYAKIFPDITNIESLNNAKIKAMVDAFDSNNRAQLSFLLGGENNYEQIFGKNTTPSLPSAGSATEQLDAILGQSKNPDVVSAPSNFFTQFLNSFGLTTK